MHAPFRPSISMTCYFFATFLLLSTCASLGLVFRNHVEVISSSVVHSCQGRDWKLGM